MLTSILLILAAIVVSLTCDISGFCYRFRIRKSALRIILFLTLIGCILPPIRLNVFVSINIGGFIAPYMLAFAYLYGQHRGGEVLRCLIAAMVSATALIFLNVGSMFSEALNGIVLILLGIALTGVISTVSCSTRGGVVAASIFGVLTYDLFLVANTAYQKNPAILGEEAILELVLYSAAFSSILALLIIPLKGEKRKNQELKFVTK